MTPLLDSEAVVLESLYRSGSLGVPSAETLHALAGLYDQGLVAMDWVNDYAPRKYSFPLTDKGQALAEGLWP